MQPDKPNEPSIAIVVPVLNEAEFLHAVLSQLKGIAANEVIFVDGGSTDGTDDLLRASGVQWVSSLAGRAAQMNCGASKTKSDILLFVHVDTAINSSHIEAIRHAMRDEKIAGGRFDVHLSGTHPMFRVIEYMMNLRSRLTKISTGDQAIFVRRKVFERLGGFPDQPLLEDVEFSRKIKCAGRLASLRQCVETSSRRWEQHGVLRTIVLMWWLRLRYWMGADPARLWRLYYG